MFKLDTVEKRDLDFLRIWRNDHYLMTARTPYRLTFEMQNDWYARVVCNRESNHRYFALREVEVVNTTDGQGVSLQLIGMGGITYIEWENRRGEIALMIGPAYQGKGYGRKAFDLLMNEGFGKLNLHTIYAEVYECNPGLGFWEKMAQEGCADKCVIPAAKYWDGQYYSAFHFTWGMRHNENRTDIPAVS